MLKAQYGLANRINSLQLVERLKDAVWAIPAWQTPRAGRVRHKPGSARRRLPHPPHALVPVCCAGVLGHAFFTQLVHRHHLPCALCRNLLGSSEPQLLICICNRSITCSPPLCHFLIFVGVQQL
jgi:hypothetical protein